jgi:hypothetical protein
MHVEVRAVDRCLVDLEVPGVDDDPGWRVNRQRHAVRHAVRDADEFDLERSDRHALSRLDRNQFVLVVDAVFLEFRFDQRQGQRRAVNRPRDQRCNVRDGADVVFMAVRQHKGGSAPFLLQVREVRNNPIHTQQLGVREHDAGVDDDRRLAPRQGQHVHSKLAKSA